MWQTQEANRSPNHQKLEILEVMLGHDDGMFNSYAEQIWKYSTKLGV